MNIQVGTIGGNPVIIKTEYNIGDYISKQEVVGIFITNTSVIYKLHDDSEIFGKINYLCL